MGFKAGISKLSSKQPDSRVSRSFRKLYNVFDKAQNKNNESVGDPRLNKPCVRKVSIFPFPYLSFL